MLRVKDGFDPMCAHLDFGKAGEEQSAWVNLLEEGTMGEQGPSAIPASWMRQLALVWHPGS